MTTTLLKHEFIRTRSLLGQYFALATLVVLAGTLLAFFNWPVLGPLGAIVSVLTIVSLVPVLHLLLGWDYWRSSYRGSGYLTHSIPVRGSRIFWTKLLWAVIVTLVALAVCVLLAAILWPAVARNPDFASDVGPNPSPNLFVVIGELWALATQFIPTGLLVTLLIAAFALILVAPIEYFFAASVGSESRFAKLGAGGPFLVFVLMYVATQALMFASFFAIPFGLGPTENGKLGIIHIDTTAAMEADQLNAAPLGFFVSMVLMCAFCLWRTHRSWNEKVSLT